MKKALFALYCLFLTITLSAQESQTTYNFLRLPISAHAAALGGDNVTLIEDDETLMFHNPALLTSVTDKTINFNYLNYMLGANMLSAAFNKNFGERASAAVSAQYVDYGSIQQTTTENKQIGNFSAKDIAIAGYFSYLLNDYWSGGITAKLITSYLGAYHSIGMGVDIGLNYYHPNTELSISLVAKNLGGQLKAYGDNYEKMPIDIQLGISKRLVHTPLRFHATLVNLNYLDDKFIHHLVTGVDILLSKQIWIGAGYHFRRANEMIVSSTNEESNHGAGFSCGAGVNLNRLKINAAYAKYHISSSSLIVNAAFSL